MSRRNFQNPEADLASIPPADVVTAEFERRIEDMARAELTERILRAAGLDRQVADAIGGIERPKTAALIKGIRESFKDNADREWREYIETEARRMIADI